MSVCRGGRVKMADSAEELQDIYLHFRLYYGQDVAAMHEQEINKKKEERKLQPKKKRIVSLAAVRGLGLMSRGCGVGTASEWVQPAR